MERVYEYDPKLYRNKVTLTNYLLVALLLVSIYCVATGSKWSLIFVIIIVVCAYGLINSFVRKANPRTVTVSNDRIVFSSYGDLSFEIKNLQMFRTKISTAGYQLYVRARDKDGRRGTFWVTYANFSDPEDLVAELDYLERKVHPESLRFRGRKELGAKRPMKEKKD